MYSDRVKEFISSSSLDHLDTRTILPLGGSLSASGYYITENIGHGFVVEGPPVFYRINSHGFRSKHFNNFENNKETILFSGCSWTFGEGLPEQYIWTQLVANKFAESGREVDHYNLGYMGQSIHHIVKNIYSFIRKYGSPKYLLVCFPDIQRNIYYSPKQEEYIKAYVNTSFIGSKDKDRERYTKIYQAEDNLLLATTLIFGLEDFCEKADIKLVWTTWNYPDYDIYKELGFNSLMDPDTSFVSANPSYNKSQSPYYPNPNSLPYWEEARDGAHPGTCWTHFISDKFYKEAIK